MTTREAEIPCRYCGVPLYEHGEGGWCFAARNRHTSTSAFQRVPSERNPDGNEGCIHDTEKWCDACLAEIQADYAKWLAKRKRSEAITPALRALVEQLRRDAPPAVIRPSSMALIEANGVSKGMHRSADAIEALLDPKNQEQE